MTSPKFTMTCGFCKTLFEGEILGCTRTISRTGYIFLQCGNCNAGNMVYVSAYKHSNLLELLCNSSHNITEELYFEAKWPKSDLKIPKGLPEKVMNVYYEAERVFESEIWGAASERYRKAIEQACRDKGQTSGNLVSKIKSLHKSGQLTKDLNDWAHEIRIVGNEAAHDDPLPKDEAQKEAQDIRLFCELFMTYVYSLPKKLEERRGLKENDK